METGFFELLKTWCDALIDHQLTGTNNPAFEGGLLCPSCKMIHGRCPDAIYPMMYMADVTGDPKYLRSARLLFDWGANMLCDDGSLYNDAHSTWNGITVFAAMGLCEALTHHGQLLDEGTRARWEAQLSGMGEWLYHNLTMELKTNVNYHASNAGAMAMLGAYFGRADYLARAKELAHACLPLISPNGLLTGEGQPADAVTPRGCSPVDIGYNVEESLPSLLRYARICNDKETENIVVDALRAHVALMLPDGAWDNSFGTRNFKWTYWGSRTSDGCQGALAMLKDDPVFYEAARRNASLYAACTHDGLLHGGPHYRAHGEKPCIHHMLCHAKVLATALDEGYADRPSVALPSDTPHGIRHYPEIDTWRVGVGPWRADVTAYDFPYMPGGHASGGTLTLLWHEAIGPVIAVGMTDYSLKEPHNMQLSLNKAAHRSVAPRLEMMKGGKRFASMYDTEVTLSARMDGEAAVVEVCGTLKDMAGNAMEPGVSFDLAYRFASDQVTISGRVSNPEAAFVLPVIALASAPYQCADGQFELETGEHTLRVAADGLQPKPDAIFNLCPGFEARGLIIHPDADGAFAVCISVG